MQTAELGMTSGVYVPVWKSADICTRGEAGGGESVSLGIPGNFLTLEGSAAHIGQSDPANPE